jgi:carboxypeptidase C (cathepsin A)
MDDNGIFTENKWSWNKEANVVYIESPAGVGYSFCDNHRLCESHSDAGSSLDNLDAILSFFEKFPEFLSNDLYLTGESYAGVYVPYLAFRIDSYNSWVEKSLVLSDHQHLDFNEFIRLKASQKH